MTQRDWLVEHFQKSRGHLLDVAYRMLGSSNEADDAVQEAWLRINNSDAADVANLGGWLTTVVARVCLDMLRSRGSRREDSFSVPKLDHVAAREGTLNPEQELLLSDSIGPALLIVLETLGPAERIAFVLHDMFDLSFDEIAAVVGRSPTSARQLASRARRRIRVGAVSADVDDLGRQRQIVNAFLAASRGGDFNAIVAVLDPSVRLRADATAIQTAAATTWGGRPELPSEVHGARAVAETLHGRSGARAALLDGVPGAVVAMGGQVRVAWTFTFAKRRIVGIDLLMDPERLGRLTVEFEEAMPGNTVPSR